MDSTYKIKYLKYKKKYLNLSKKSLNNYQTGGANINILFGCTTLIKNSTLYNYFDLINTTINKLLSTDEKKQTHFAMEQNISSFITKEDIIKKEIIDEILLKKMIDNNYIISEETNQNVPLIKYINDEFLLKNQKIDVLVLAECNDIVSSLTMNNIFNNYIIKIFKSSPKIKLDYKELFELLKINLLNLYKSINGFIININYNKDKFINIEYNVALVTFYYILLHYICCKIFNKLFSLVEEGVYKKNIGITDIEYNSFCDEIYKINVDIFTTIITDKDKTYDDKYKAILSIFLPQYIEIEIDNIKKIIIKRTITYYDEE